MRTRPATHQLIGRLEVDDVDAGAGHDLDDARAHEAAAHDTNGSNVTRFHGPPSPPLPAFDVGAELTDEHEVDTSPRATMSRPMSALGLQSWR